MRTSETSQGILVPRLRLATSLSIDSLDPDIPLEYDGWPGEDGAQATREIVV
jgi:hypothetical protein